jgi:hypothetical protein
LGLYRLVTEDGDDALIMRYPFSERDGLSLDVIHLALEKESVILTMEGCGLAFYSQDRHHKRRLIIADCYGNVTEKRGNYAESAFNVLLNSYPMIETHTMRGEMV